MKKLTKYFHENKFIICVHVNKCGNAKNITYINANK